jgi:hypothetical protein
VVTTLHLRIEHAGADRSSLVDQLARKADVNRDGTVSDAEFRAYLSDVTGTAAALEPAPPSAEAPQSAAAPRTPTGAEPTEPNPKAKAAALDRAIARTNGDR